MFTAIRISGAIILSALIAFAVTAEPAAIRHETLPSSELQPVKPAKFISALMGADCSQHIWPSYDANCRFNDKRDGSAERIVRVIALR